MTTDKTQTADGAPNGAAGGSAAGTADLDALINEFEGAKKPPSTPTPTLPDDLKPVIAWARSEMSSRVEEAVRKDVTDAIKFVKEDDALRDLPDKMVKGMLEAHAGEDPSFKEAFENRRKSPQVWQAKLAEARTAVANDLKPFVGTTRVQSDVMAARASIGGETRNPEGDAKLNPVELVHMSQRDFDKMIERKLAESAR